MSFYEDVPSTDSSITLVDLRRDTERSGHRREIFSGLASASKHIPSKYFYDARGSVLFEEITRLPEYYLTRTEKSILPSVANEIRGLLEDVDIIELGSGDCSKISILLSAVPARRMPSIRYVPIDVSRSAIEESARTLPSRFYGLSIQGIVADFTTQLALVPRGRRRLFCFFGSTIGNFSRGEAVRFMGDLGGIMRPGDAMLLGVDMVKDKHILESAYNDRRGVTAEFNRNILRAVNDLTGTDFDPDRFEHLAFYDSGHSRIEMHLRAERDMEISSPHLDGGVRICAGETIHTENSRKFTEEAIDDLALASGLRIDNRYTDKNRWFSVVLLRNEG
jgi:L-histidine N-alpha-methyltransferase